MESDAKALDVDPIRKSVSAVAGRLADTSAAPMASIHSGPSLCTMATETAGVWVSLRIFSSCWRSSGMDVAGLKSSFFGAARAARDTESRQTTVVIRKRMSASPFGRHGATVDKDCPIVHPGGIYGLKI